MLTKLMKYELKATARVMVPLCILSIALASVTQITLWTFLDETGSSPYSVTLILLIATAAAMGAVLAATVVLIVQRFRSNLLGDEGHVMFTLPVSIHQHILAKFLVGVFWMLATLFVLFESIICLGYNGTLWMAFPPFREALTAFMNYISPLSSVTPDFSVGESLAILFGAVLASNVALCLEIYAPLALGHSFHKHKGLLSVAFFLGIQGIYHLLSGSLPYLMNFVTYLFPTQSPTGVYMLDFGGSMVFSLLWAVVLYAITHYTLKHRLNLE